MTNHTPGPWEIFPQEFSDGRIEIHAGNKIVCSVLPGSAQSFSIFSDEKKHNAMLISAVPEMAKALLSVMSLHDYFPFSEDLYGQKTLKEIKDALKKAGFCPKCQGGDLRATVFFEDNSTEDVFGEVKCWFCMDDDGTLEKFKKNQGNM